VNGLSHQSW